MPIEFTYEIEEHLSEETVLNFERLLEVFYQFEDVPKHAIIDLTLVDNAIIQEINRDYREKDMATDVLSFPQYERDDDLTGEEYLLYGDVVISLERAKEQAEEYNHSLNRELCYLFVHSLLHLRGYDHMTESEKEEMRAHEERILLAIGITRDA